MDGTRLNSGNDSDTQWARISSELVAYRVRRRAAWGDLDDLTLARYLAGEATAAETEQVRQAMDQHPKVRECVAIVREVGEDLVSTEGERVAAPRATISHREPTRRSLRRWRFFLTGSSIAASLLLVSTLTYEAFTRGHFLITAARWDTRARLLEDAEAKRKARVEKAIVQFAAKSAPAQTPAGRAAPAPSVAPPANTANLLIALESAHVGNFLPGDQRQFLRVILKISNQSKVAEHTVTWPGTGVKLTLRDSGFQMLPEVERQFEKKTLKGGEAVHQAVFFDRPAVGADLTLVLTLPGGPAQGRLGEVKIPASAIQQVP